jgi:hypothetical protein
MALSPRPWGSPAQGVATMLRKTVPTYLCNQTSCVGVFAGESYFILFVSFKNSTIKSFFLQVSISPSGFYN